jgi:hypothetical protein
MSKDKNSLKPGKPVPGSWGACWELTGSTSEFAMTFLGKRIVN